MLGKLLKYEFKSTARMLPIVYLAVGMAYLLGLLAKALNIGQFKITMSVFLVIGGIAAVIMALVTVIVRYFKGLYGAEGYLSQTLPVSKGCLIASKVINAYIWTIISFAVAFFATLSMLQLNDIDQLDQLMEYIKSGSYTPLIIYVVLASFIELFAFLGELYFAITLANTRMFIKSNAIFSVLFYFVTYTVVSILELPAMFFIPLGVKMSLNGAVWTTDSMFKEIGFKFISSGNESLSYNIPVGIGNLFVEAAVGIVLLLVARWLMEHKTSVK